MIVPNPDDLPPMTQQEALRIMQAVTRRPQTHYEGYQAGMSDCGHGSGGFWADLTMVKSKAKKLVENSLKNH